MTISLKYIEQGLTAAHMANTMIDDIRSGQAELDNLRYFQNPEEEYRRINRGINMAKRLFIIYEGQAAIFIGRDVPGAEDDPTLSGAGLKHIE